MLKFETVQDIIKLEKAPKVAAYSPKNKQPWDDAVTLVLEYSEIPYDVRIAVILIFIVVFLIGIILNIPAIERIRKVWFF